MDLTSVAALRFNLNGSTNCVEPLPDPGQTKPPVFVLRPRRTVIETNAIVRDPTMDGPGLLSKANTHATCASVFAHVCERFRDNTVNGRFNGSGKAAVRRSFHGDLQFRAL
jgi:hypothetical protein